MRSSGAVALCATLQSAADRAFPGDAVIDNPTHLDARIQFLLPPAARTRVE